MVVSILVLQSSRWEERERERERDRERERERERESWLPCVVFLPGVSCCVALPRDAIGLSAVCDCGIS